MVPQNVTLNLKFSGGDADWAAFPEPGGESTAVSHGADTWGTFSEATVTAVPDDIDDDEFGDFEDVPSISVSVPKVMIEQTFHHISGFVSQPWYQPLRLLSEHFLKHI